MKTNYFAKIKNMPKESKASIAYVICNIIQKSLTFLTMPFFTRLLSLEQYGQYTLYTSWLAMLIIFTSLELPYGTFNTAMIDFKDDRDGYLSSAQTICTVFTSVLLLIYLPFRSIVNGFIEFPTFIIVVMFLETLFQSSFMFWCARQRFDYKYISVVVVTIIMSILSPVLAFVLINFTEERGYARILGYSLVTIGIGFIIYIINCKKGRKFFTKKYWKYALSLNLPLIIYYLSQMLFNQSDRLMIKYLCGTDKAGIYGAAYSLAIVLTVVLNAINNAYNPWLYERINEKKHKDNQKVACIIAIIMGVLLSAVIWFAPEIIFIMAGDKYMEAIWVVPPVAASIMLLLYSQFSVNIEFYYKNRLSLIFASIIGAVFNIILNFLLIPIFGYLAAGYTTFASYVLFVVFNYLCIRKYVKKGAELNGIYNMKLLMLILAGFILVNLVGMAFYKLLIVRFAVLFIAFIVAIIFRKKIFEIVMVLLHKEKKDVVKVEDVSKKPQE